MLCCRDSYVRCTMASDTLLAPIEGADHREMGGVQIDTVPAANCRVKRVVYPAGFRWSRDIKPLGGTDYCMHAHVGFLAQGEIHMEFADGCVLEYRAPQVIAIEPGHDGWVDGNTPV